MIQSQDQTLGVRPEDLRVDAPDRPGVAARVAEVEPLGNETLVFLDAGGVALTARLDAATPVRRGDAITVTVAPEALHWCDAETENRMA